MAKKFNDIYLEAKSSVYGSPSNVLTVLAKQNSQVEFTPVLRPGALKGDLTLAPQYTVQRRKRPSVNTVAAQDGTTAKALAALDQFTVNDWDALEVGTGNLKSVGFKQIFGDEYDFSSNPQHARDMVYQVGEVAAQRHKDLIALLLTAGKTGAALPAYAAGSVAVWEAIAGEVDKLAKVDDQYMDIQALSDFVVITTNSVAMDLTKEMGTAFNQEAPIAQTGFKSGMSINGTPVIVDARLSGRETIIMHKEALGFKSDPAKKDVAVDLGLVEYTGEFFYDIMALIDSSRIKKFGATTK